MANSSNIQAEYCSQNGAIQYWINCTGAPSKINMGLASYGRTFTLEDNTQHAIGSRVTGPGPAGNYVPESGFLPYNEVCLERKMGLWKIYSVPEQDVKYGVKDNVWVGIDDIETIKNKVGQFEIRNFNINTSYLLI